MLNTAPWLVVRRSLRLNSHLAGLLLAASAWGWILLAQASTARARSTTNGMFSARRIGTMRRIGRRRAARRAPRPEITPISQTVAMPLSLRRSGTTLGIDSLLFDGVAGGQVDQSSDTLTLSGSDAVAEPAGPGRLRIGAVNAGAFGTYNLTGTGTITATQHPGGRNGGRDGPGQHVQPRGYGRCRRNLRDHGSKPDIGGAAGGAVGNGVYNLKSGSLTVAILRRRRSQLEHRQRRRLRRRHEYGRQCGRHR